jgi:hypothetical protein
MFEWGCGVVDAHRLRLTTRLCAALSPSPHLSPAAARVQFTGRRFAGEGARARRGPWEGRRGREWGGGCLTVIPDLE